MATKLVVGQPVKVVDTDTMADGLVTYVCRIWQGVPYIVGATGMKIPVASDHNLKKLLEIGDIVSYRRGSGLWVVRKFSADGKISIEVEEGSSIKFKASFDELKRKSKVREDNMKRLYVGQPVQIIGEFASTVKNITTKIVSSHHNNQFMVDGSAFNVPANACYDAQFLKPMLTLGERVTILRDGFFSKGDVVTIQAFQPESVLVSEGDNTDISIPLGDLIEIGSEKGQPTDSIFIDIRNGLIVQGMKLVTSTNSNYLMVNIEDGREYLYSKTEYAFYQRVK
ncbi:hypothetical protein Arno18_128 [Pectobacterium phage Arno18]|uniref:Uncharacterized protein n=1 Tax=Pectobacterium phage Arno18 TaxID=2500578 RepID=A0A678ZKA4_9CAUD|nr:hypothetical protein Arno18_128 [Pectobacterium phage Arno18]